MKENDLARVIAEHRERYVIQFDDQTFQAEITGHMRYASSSREELPAVGDVVRFQMMDADTAVILSVEPRMNVLRRKSPGNPSGIQLIAANIDTAFIVQAAGQDFNMNRLERYLTIIRSAQIEPCYILTKVDLITPDEVDELRARIRQRNPGIPTLAVSNLSGAGMQELQAYLEPEKTYCFVGSSGVGKSSLINYLLSDERIQTREISQGNAKGRHTTSHRELYTLPDGSFVIDTPGMREVGLTDDEEGVASVFQEIAQLAAHCRFADCSHTGEDGCAVQAAVDNGDLDPAQYENYMKLQREQEHHSLTIREKRKKDRDLGKLYLSIQREKNRNKPF